MIFRIEPGIFKRKSNTGLSMRKFKKDSETGKNDGSSRTLRMAPYVIVALALHVPVFVYPVLRISYWLEFAWITTMVILVPVFFSQIIARVALRGKSGKRVFILRTMADFILGLVPVVIPLLLFFELFVWLFSFDTKLAAQCIVFVTACIIVSGIYHAFNPRLVSVNLSSSKLGKPLRFAQISDVHIGSRSTRFLSQLITRINSLDVDFLCITGDFIDQPGITAYQLRSLQNFNGPIYFTIGNHERYEDLEDIIGRLESLGVEVLRNRSVTANGIQFIGIDDKDDITQVASQLKNFEVHADHYVILLYHRPNGLEACDEHGVDLMLSGHTHGGQIVPFNLAVKKVFDRVSGLYHYGNATLYVSEGTGTWGPTMRFGTRSEITLFEVNPPT